jgi:hypothetical protein
MRKIVTSSMSVALLLILVSLTFAQTKVPWFHLEVRENKGEPELVKVNLPMSMVDVALRIAQEKKLHNGRIKLPSNEISVPDMRELWNDLKKAGNADFVTVEKKNERVRIAREGSFVIINVLEKDASKVDVRVPVAVVDALLTGTGDELDIKAALLAMQQKNIGDIVTVNDQQTQVRLWID